MNTKQLRQKILDLAIRGKLVPQDPNDEPASVLLTRIAKEKERLVKEGKIKAEKKGKQFSVSTDRSHCGNMPEGWAWCRLGDAIELYSGQDLTPDRYNDCEVGIPYITGASCLEKGHVLVNRWTEMPQTHSYYGDLLLTCKGAGVGKMAISHLEDAHIARQIMAIRPYCDIRIKYLQYVLSAGVKDLIEQANGLIPGIRREIILDFPLPLPPLSEQNRIVDTVELAFAFIDEIEQNKTDLQIAVAAAKSKILSLAVSGKLVPQDESDEPASILLDRIKAERAKLIKAGRIKPDKRGKATAATTRDSTYYTDMPFNVPKTWAWCAFGEVCDYGNCENETPDNITADAWILDLEDIEKDTGRIIAFVSKAEREFYSNKHIFHAGQVLYSNLRPYLKKVLVAPKAGYCTSEIIPLKFDVAIDSGYVRYLLMSPYFLAYADLCSYGVKMPRLGATNAKKALIPLPPLSEQRRISAVIEVAFAQLDGIAAELA
jgi:type I restriction enzyme S subunit